MARTRLTLTPLNSDESYFYRGLCAYWLRGNALPWDDKARLMDRFLARRGILEHHIGFMLYDDDTYT